MADVSSTGGAKRKMAAGDSDPPSKSFRDTPLSSFFLLLKIPADINSSLPVWEAVRSQKVDVTWTVRPYSISVHLTPATSKQGKATTSGKSESAANAAEAVGLSSIILQPPMVTRPVAQRHGTFQNTSCVLLTFPHNSIQLMSRPPAQPRAVALKSAISVIFTQSQPAHQPSTPIKNGEVSTIQTPSTTPREMQAPSKTPVPSPFHTKNSSEVQICDSFLLNMCYAGEKCRMHHTPYPFHWQLWCVITHQWVDISSRSQVLLERIYCDVSNEGICIKDGNVRYSLNFESMELDDSSKYGAVRRLTNSNCLIESPYFPSKWKIYWCNNINWEEYNKSVSTLLLTKMSEKESECSFHMGTQEYKLDFTRMTQTNVTTGFQRRVCCRPIYRSPDSMQPYLKTGINTDSTEDTSDPPGANFRVDPLEEFSSWYPPVWRLPLMEDYSLVDVPVGTQAYRRVQNVFHKSMPETKVDIISIQQVQNLLHWDKYQRHKTYMQKQDAKSKDPLERHLFHGTTKEASEVICHNNFDPRVAGVNGTSNGFGSYFATTASYSNAYSYKVGPDEVRHMFLVKVLVGKVCVGRHAYRRPPPINSRKKHYRLYDTCVDNMDKPTMFVVFDSCQCYPYYLIKYKDLPKEIDI